MEKKFKMDKYGTRLIMVFVTLLGSLALAGCSILGTGTPVQPTETATSAATAVPTKTPTETSTPTQVPLSADSFKVENGQVEQNVNGSWQVEQIPSDVREIDSVELHEGQMYGIDTLGRAVIVQNSQGEWLDYERPIETFGLPESDIPTELLKDLNQEKVVTRLNDGGTPVPWGIIKTEHPYTGSDFGHVFVSGYSLGIFVNDLPNKNSNYLLFEVPLRYQRQLFTFWMPDQSNVDLNVFSIPASGNIQDIQQKPLTFKDYAQMMEKPEVVGHQIVLAFEINQSDVPNTSFTYKDYDIQVNALVDSLTKGEALSIFSSYLNTSWEWVDASFFK